MRLSNQIFPLRRLLSTVLLLFGCIVTPYLSAEEIFDDFDGGPSRGGWLIVGDRNCVSWNDKGWIDVKPGRRATRLMKQLSAPLGGSEDFFFEYDVMVIGDCDDNGVYRGLMTPYGDNFANFVGSASVSNGAPASVVKSKGERLDGEAAKQSKPYMLRIAGEYKAAGDKGELRVKAYDLLDGMKEVSSSELIFPVGAVDWKAMTVFGLGNRLKGEGVTSALRYDNFYFSTTGPNKKPKMPSFISSDLVKVKRLHTFTSQKELKVRISFESIVDSDKLEARATVLPYKKLRGDEIWTGTLGPVKLSKGGVSEAEYTITVPDAQMWSPDSPQLYTLNIGLYDKFNRAAVTESVDFGFRDFEARDGRFYLNGNPVFLRGLSLNPPGKDVLPKIGQRPSFISDYIRDLKLRNVNVIRMYSDDYELLGAWMKVCDELGMMVFQGCYGTPPGGSVSAPPNDIVAAVEEYKDKYFGNYLKHPSVVINILASGVGRTDAERKVYDEWFKRVCKRLKTWNPSSVYLANAGDDKSSAGDINDRHFYAGWYYGSFLNYLDFRKPVADVTEPERPFTLSECVGAFNTARYGFSMSERQVGAALCWGGSEYGDSKMAMRYQAFMVRQAIEQFRRFREHNGRLAGIMPYFLPYSNWDKVRVFSEMNPKPAADQMRVSFQPVLLCWENWTPNCYSGGELKAVGHVINDAYNGKDLLQSTFQWELSNYHGSVFANGSEVVPLVKYYEARSIPVKIKLDEKLEPGVYRLVGNLRMGGRLISSNEMKLYIANKDWVVRGQSDNNAVRVLDSSGKLKDVMKRLGIKHAEVMNLSSLRTGNVLVVGGAADAGVLSKQRRELDAFVTGGGRVLLCDTDPELLKALGLEGKLLPVKLEPGAGVFINVVRESDMLSNGLPDSALDFWSDPDGWNEGKPGYPRVSPLKSGLMLAAEKADKDVAVLANFGTGLKHVALAEVFRGDGAIVVSTFDHIAFAGFDPVADRFLMNLISYVCSKKKHLKYPEVGAVIRWGDYKSERGIFLGPESGLFLNGMRLESLEGPLGNEYAANGRLIAGPFKYTSQGEFMFMGRDGRSEAAFFVTVPKAAKYMSTVLRNDGAEASELSIRVNRQPPSQERIEAGKTLVLKSLLPYESNELEVMLKATPGVVLLESRFE